MNTPELVILAGGLLALVGVIAIGKMLFSGGLEKTKTRLSVAVTAVGLLSAVGGLVKECGGPAPSPSPEPPPAAYACCTPYGSCPMTAPVQPGTPCTCWDAYGNYAAGITCN